MSIHDEDENERTAERPARPSRQALGAEGEERAVRLLEARGYRIADRNVRAGGVEIDVVAERAGVVVFVEVKTRRSTRHGGGELSVGWSKQQRLIRGALAWLADRRRRARGIRFDVIAWQVDETGARPHWHLTHYEGAFDASG
jgi:putative endonuclease